jgi:hypothetical protein
MSEPSAYIVPAELMNITVKILLELPSRVSAKLLMRLEAEVKPHIETEPCV